MSGLKSGDKDKKWQNYFLTLMYPQLSLDRRAVRREKTVPIERYKNWIYLFIAKEKICCVIPNGLSLPAESLPVAAIQVLIYTVTEF